MTATARREQDVSTVTGGGQALVWARRVSLVVAALALVSFFGHGLPTDLHVYVEGGSAVLHGRDLYGPAVSVEGYPFTYPPFAALPFAVLAALPVWLIIAITCAVFYACLALVVQVCAPGLLARVGHSWWAWLTILVILAFNPVWATLKDGQVNMVLAALVLVDLLRPHRARGVFVGVAAAIKLTPAIFVLYLLATRQWAAARNAVLGFVVCTALAWAVLPGATAKFWTHSLFDTTRVGDSARVSNQSLFGLARKQVGDGAGAHVLWVVLGLIAAVVTLWTARRLHEDGQDVLALGLVGVLGCLLSPITWTHHWVWAVPVLLGVIASPWWHSWWTRAATVVGCAVFVRGAAATPPSLPVLHLILGNLYTLTGAAVIAALAVRCLRRPSASGAAARAPSRWLRRRPTVPS